MKTTGTVHAARLRTFGAAILVYLGFRLLGATRTHAWDRARLLTVDAMFDRIVERTGLADPRRKGDVGTQVFFEGGPLDGETRFVEGSPDAHGSVTADCGAMAIPRRDAPDDPVRHVYRRTDRMRVQQTIFEYRGLMIPPAHASDIDARAEPPIPRENR